MNFDITVLGLAAGTLTVVAFLPQIIKIRKRKSAKDISWLWIFGFFLGVFLWFVYGLLTQTLAIIVANGAMLTLGIVLSAFKFNYDNK